MTTPAVVTDPSVSLGAGGSVIAASSSSAANNPNASVVASSVSASSAQPVFPPCTYCLKKMGPVGAKCAICEDFYICLHCFSVGAEIASHRKEHDYYVLDAGQFRLFDKPITWTATETLALLDGVEHHGFGNWVNVVKCVPTRTPDECATFFVNMFIEGNLGRVFNANKLDIVIQDHSTPASPISLLPPVEMTLDEKRELGYYPMRDDFELEFDHNAEQLISDLVFRADDDEDQTAYKIWQMDRYRLRLANRIKHKTVARDYGLIVSSSSEGATSASNGAAGTGATSGSKGGRSKDGAKDAQRNDLFANFEFLRPLSRYKSADEMKMLVENLKKEKQLRDRIKHLTNLKKSGVTKLKHVEEKSSPVKNRHRTGKKGEILVEAKRSPGSPAPPPESPTRYATRSANAGSPTLMDDYSPDLADMMTERERKVCHGMKMTYRAYFNAKTAILKDYLARRRGCPVKLRYPPGLDPAHRRQIIGLMTDNGWMDEDAN